MKLNRLKILIFLTIILFTACKPEDEGDKYAPELTSSTPSNNAKDVDISTQISLQFTEKIILSSNHQIKLNNVPVSATASGRTLNIAIALKAGTDYTLIIPAKSILDESGNAATEIKLQFSTAKATLVDGTLYEAESALLSGDATIAKTTPGYSGAGYVNTNTGNVTFNLQISENGYYDLFFNYIAAGQKNNFLYVDGVQTTDITFINSASWNEMKVATLKLTTGSHTIALIKNWGYIQLDYLRINKSAYSPIAFNIASNPASPNPSTQLTNLYGFLRTNFGKNILSGAMAAHSTNLNESNWIFEKTGRYPAITGFDFIDHTWLNQNWVNYAAPFTLGQEWWNNNGIVTISWHWRDPLTKSGSYNTYSNSNPEGTTFDVSKISDPNSAEYKAMIVDIDIIASYLKQFNDAGIPILWRPLHEAEGTWFWWGAKGAEPCKTLWKLMFERLVKHHGLNNLLRVWTTSASDNAANWYPGDAYVDILGMDIYPGANQHGSQYVSFNKVREFTAGKKMITLSECGSVPDPALMMENGDIWSWFMPWNGDYTRSDTHNGASWWNKFFNYSYIITRDKMPNLK